MSGFFRVTVVKKKGNETVRTEEIEVLDYRDPIAIGTTPYPESADAPPAVLEAAEKLLKRGEAIGAIVHITPEWMQVNQPMTPEQIEAQIARLQRQLEELT